MITACAGALPPVSQSGGARQTGELVPASITSALLTEYVGEGNSLVDPGGRIVINP